MNIKYCLFVTSDSSNYSAPNVHILSGMGFISQVATPLCAISRRLRLLSAEPTPIRHVNKQAINFHGFSYVFITVEVECALEPRQRDLPYSLYASDALNLVSFLSLLRMHVGVCFLTAPGRAYRENGATCWKLLQIRKPPIIEIRCDNKWEKRFLSSVKALSILGNAITSREKYFSIPHKQCKSRRSILPLTMKEIKYKAHSLSSGKLKYVRIIMECYKRSLWIGSRNCIVHVLGSIRNTTCMIKKQNYRYT